jgi:integrase
MARKAGSLGGSTPELPSVTDIRGGRTPHKRPKRVRVERGLYQRGKTYSACATPTGESKPLWKSLGTVNLSMARRLRDEWVAEVRQGKIVRSKAKFGEVARKWIEQQERRVGSGELRQTTYDGYEVGLRLHVLPHFENRVLQTIKPDDLVAWHQGLKARGTSDGYTANLWKPLRQVFGYAVRNGYLTSNPADALTKRERPKPGPKRIRCLGAEEIDSLLSNASERYRLALEMAIFLGVRLSELRAIRWQDADFESGMVRINGQCDRRGKRLDYGKTEAADREVVLMDGLAKKLKAHKLASPFSQPEDFVIASETGTAM